MTHNAIPSMDLDAYLRTLPGRCPDCGHHVRTQGCHCNVTPIAPTDEWSIFRAAIRRAVRDDGTVHQTEVRPLIAAIPAKHRGLMYRRARSEGVLVEAGWEQSTDVAGRNGDKQQRYYRIGTAA